jgi:quercetin dioxygenase-like cupin family protein
MNRRVFAAFHGAPGVARISHVWAASIGPARTLKDRAGMPAASGGRCARSDDMADGLMMDETKTAFSHVKEGDTPWRDGGLRDFFEYRDLGIADATGGQVVAQLTRAKRAPEEGTGWHRHEVKFHIVIMLKGWARFMYEDKDTLVKAGDCVHQRPGIVHYLYDYSSDMEYLEIAAPAGFTTVDMPPAAAVPKPTPWK